MATPGFEAAALMLGACFGATSDPNSDSEDVPEGSAGVGFLQRDQGRSPGFFAVKKKHRRDFFSIFFRGRELFRVFLAHFLDGCFFFLAFLVWSFE